MRIRTATQDDRQAILNLLRRARLPVDDVFASDGQTFFLAEKDGQALGCIGLEKLADCALLRSLVVDSSSRKGGLGGQLLHHLKVAATASGIRELWLLTIDADGYFERKGFGRVDREQAPPGLKQSAEFSTLCPASAILMSKAL